MICEVCKQDTITRQWGYVKKRSLCEECINEFEETISSLSNKMIKSMPSSIRDNVGKDQFIKFKRYPNKMIKSMPSSRQDNREE